MFYVGVAGKAKKKIIMTDQLQYDMQDTEIDFDGTTTTDDDLDDDDACHGDYNTIVYGLMNRDQIDTAFNTAVDTSKTSQEKETTSESKTASNTSNSLEEDSNDATNIQKILFLLQRDFSFDWVKCNRLYRVHHRDNKDVAFALKIAKRSSNDRHAYPIELRILSHIRKKLPAHPHLPQICGFMTFKNLYAFLTPYATSLRDICKEYDLRTDLNDIRAIMHQLLIAIRDLHAIGIMHRDIKPSNILWQDKKLILTDYDCASWSSAKRRHTELRGTPGFIAPEMLYFERDQIEIPTYYTHQVDIYSAGVVLGCLLFHVSESEVTESYVCAFRNICHSVIQDTRLAHMLTDMIKVNHKERLNATQLLAKYFF